MRALVAAAAMLLALGWVIADVEVCDAGHLNGLFYVGPNAKLPAGWIADNTYRVRDPHGYDGEFYYLIAHDPLNRQGYLPYVDTPRYRWRRIALPALAHVLALGDDVWTDRVYVGLELAFVFLGAWWLAAFAEQNRQSAWWGLGFLLIPAVAVSLDRMTVDLPLAALCVGALYFAAQERTGWAAYGALAAAPLVRETGILLIAAWCVYRLLRRNMRAALLGAACAAPALLWWLYVALHTYRDVISFATIPFLGLIEWTVNALKNPAAVYGPRANAVLELANLAGIWLAFGLAMYVAARCGSTAKNWKLPELLAVIFAAFACVIGYQDIWGSTYGTSRTLSPMLLALAAIAVRDRRMLYASPLLLAAPRIALQFASELKVALFP